MPSFLWALPILSALGGIGWWGSVLLWGVGRGFGFIASCPLLPLEEEDPGSRGLLVGVGMLGVGGGFGHLLLLAHVS